MTAHAVVRQEVPASIEETFDLVHDYPRLTRLGELSFRTRYVTFRRPDLAAVALVDRPPLFASWAASIRHRSLEGGRSEVVYTLTFT